MSSVYTIFSQFTLLNELFGNSELHPDNEKLRRTLLLMPYYAKYSPGHDRVEECANALVDWLSMVKEPTPDEIELKNHVLKFIRKKPQGENQHAKIGTSEYPLRVNGS
jgi:hypothetical protein